MEWYQKKELVKLKLLEQFKKKTDICLLMYKGKRSEPLISSRILGCSEFSMNIEVSRDFNTDEFNIRFIEYEPMTYNLGDYLDISDNNALSKENYLVEDFNITSSVLTISLTSCCLGQINYSFRKSNIGTHVNEICHFYSGAKSLEFNHLDGLMSFEGYVDMADITSKTGYSPIRLQDVDLNGINSFVWDKSVSEELIVLFKKMVEESIRQPKVVNSPALSIIYAIKEWINVR